MERILGYTVKLFIISEGEKDLAGILTYSEKKGPFSRIVVPPVTPFSSLITRFEELPATSSSHLQPYGILLEHLEREFDGIRIHNHPSLRDVRLFQWKQWLVSPLYTYLIDIEAPYDTNETSWSTGTRRAYRKHADNYTFREDNTAIEAAIGLCAKSYKRHDRGLPVSQKQLFEFCTYLQRHNMVRIFTVSQNSASEPEAAVVLLYDRQTAYYWLAGSEPGHGMTILLGQLFRFLPKTGLKYFDFVGANTQLIAEFKRRFGSTLTPYYAVQHRPNRVLATLENIKRSRRLF